MINELLTAIFEPFNRILISVVGIIIAVIVLTIAFEYMMNYDVPKIIQFHWDGN